MDKTIEKHQETRQSQATRIKNLFTKHKKWLKTTYECAEFEEPIMFLERRNGEVQWYEKATAGLFSFDHSDGSKRFLVLVPNKQKKFGFGNKRFRGYYCHEDYPLPLPQDPYLTTEQLNIIVEKSLNDINKWKATEYKAKGEMWKKIGIGIALVIGALALYAILAPKNPDVIVQTLPAVTPTT